MRAHVPLVSVAVISGLSMLACGSGPIESYSRKASWTPPPYDPTSLQGAYTVPPDRSLAAISVSTVASSAGDAAEQVRADIDALTTAASDDEHCTVELHTYAPPSRVNRDEWRASAQLVLDTTLVGAGTALERMARIDACRGLVLPMTTYGSEDVGDRQRTVALHEGALAVDAPAEHLQALLDRRAKVLSAVAEVPGAPQLHPEDLRCVPSGFGIGARTLEGVVLTLDMPCRVQTAEPPPEG